MEEVTEDVVEKVKKTKKEEEMGMRKEVAKQKFNVIIMEKIIERRKLEQWVWFEGQRMKADHLGTINRA